MANVCLPVRLPRARLPVKRGQSADIKDRADSSAFYQVLPGDHPRDNFAARLEAEIPHLLRRACALTRDELLAGDLVQDCLVRALSKKHLWQEGTNLRAWLFTLLRNLLIDNRRRVAGEGVSVALNEDEPSLGAAPTQDSKLELRDLNHALARLPEEMRTVILLVCLHGLRYGAVAKILDIPFGTVCSRLHRGREELRRLIGHAPDRPDSVDSAHHRAIALAPLENAIA